MRLPLALYSLSISLGPASAADRNVSANKIKYVITPITCTVKSLIQTRVSIRKITIQGDGGGPLVEATIYH